MTKIKSFPLNSLAFITVIIWSIIILSSAIWNEQNHDKEIEAIIREMARSSIERDKLFRLWGTTYGPIYAPVSDKTPPNIYLTEGMILHRDLQISPDLILTMINPAYMTRQIYDLAQKTNTISGHITSLNPINPQNSPTKWEIKALRAVDKGADEYSEIVKIDGQEHLCMLRPLRVQKSCLKCHAAQGYKEGDLRGGISVSLPLSILHGKHAAEHHSILLGHFLIWAIGLIGVLGAFVMLGRLETARLKAEEQIVNLAHFDRLTGLVNRNLLQDRLKQALTLATRKKNKVALLYIDLDRFKPINDNFGHETGDTVLREVADRLRNSVRKSDTVARIGGDEFVIVLGDIIDKTEAEMIANKVLASMRNPFIINGREHSAGASIGIAFFPDDGEAMDTLLKKADEAMYQVKSQNGDDFKLY